MEPTTDRFDVTILGGGLAGLTLARQLLNRRPFARILVLEKRRHPVPEGAYKVGESTIEVGAHYLAEEVGLKKHLVDRQLPKFGLRFFFSGGRDSLAESLEVGLSEFFPAPGYQVDRGRLENHLFADVAAAGATNVDGAQVKQIELGSAGALHQVKFTSGDELHTVSSRWVVDASGRAALLKRQLDLAEAVEHKVHAAWFRIQTKICVDCWDTDPKWRSRTGRVPRRWLSTNHLLGRGYWIWIIPLACGTTSIGIVADPRLHPLSTFNSFDKALAWLRVHEPLCADHVAAHRDHLQDFMAIKNIAHSCREVYSANRWAITGEAGVFLDPLYSPGIDYIALANTQICSLIDHDLNGEAIDLLAARYQGIFLTLFRDNLRTYQDQYPLFGNPRVMSLKYVWDYAIYWSFPALLYFHHKLTDPKFFGALGDEIDVLRELNKQMQQFFREWDARDRHREPPFVFVDQSQIAILKQLNSELKDRLSDHDLRDRFTRNVKILQELYAEITARVPDFEPDGKPVQGTPMRLEKHRLSGVFDALGV